MCTKVIIWLYSQTLCRTRIISAVFSVITAEEKPDVKDKKMKTRNKAPNPGIYTYVSLNSWDMRVLSGWDALL